jgi:hypothetical protein
LCGDGRWTEDGAGFVDFKAVGAGILKISKYEWAKQKKKESDQKMNTK